MKSRPRRKRGSAALQPPPPADEDTLTPDDAVKPARAGRDLGVKVHGSACEGHEVAISHPDALAEIFGTDDADQANVLFAHCLKVLTAGEAGDAGPYNDNRQFMVSIIRDMAHETLSNACWRCRLRQPTSPPSARGDGWRMQSQSRRCKRTTRASTNSPVPLLPRSRLYGNTGRAGNRQ